MRSRIGTAFALTIVIAAACGKPGGPPEQAGSDATVTTPRTEAPVVAEGREVPEAAPRAVDLPARFPTDFPIGPESTVLQARTRAGSSGSLSDVTLVTEGAPEEIFEWYRSALSGAGWMIASEGRSGGIFRLHATQETSTVDLTTEPYPEGGNPRLVRTHATIWKVEPPQL